MISKFNHEPQGVNLFNWVDSLKFKQYETWNVTNFSLNNRNVNSCQKRTGKSSAFTSFIRGRRRNFTNNYRVLNSGNIFKKRLGIFNHKKPRKTVRFSDTIAKQRKPFYSKQSSMILMRMENPTFNTKCLDNSSKSNETEQHSKMHEHISAPNTPRSDGTPVKNKPETSVMKTKKPCAFNHKRNSVHFSLNTKYHDEKRKKLLQHSAESHSFVSRRSEPQVFFEHANRCCFNTVSQPNAEFNIGGSNMESYFTRCPYCNVFCSNHQHFGQYCCEHACCHQWQPMKQSTLNNHLNLLGDRNYHYYGQIPCTAYQMSPNMQFKYKDKSHNELKHVHSAKSLPAVPVRSNLTQNSISQTTQTELESKQGSKVHKNEFKREEPDIDKDENTPKLSVFILKGSKQYLFTEKEKVSCLPSDGNHHKSTSKLNMEKTGQQCNPCNKPVKCIQTLDAVNSVYKNNADCSKLFDLISKTSKTKKDVGVAKIDMTDQLNSLNTQSFETRCVPNEEYSLVYMAHSYLKKNNIEPEELSKILKVHKPSSIVHGKANDESEVDRKIPKSLITKNMAITSPQKGGQFECYLINTLIDNVFQSVLCKDSFDGSISKTRVLNEFPKATAINMFNNENNLREKVHLKQKFPKKTTKKELSNKHDAKSAQVNLQKTKKDRDIIKKPTYASQPPGYQNVHVLPLLKSQINSHSKVNLNIAKLKRHATNSEPCFQTICQKDYNSDLYNSSNTVIAEFSYSSKDTTPYDTSTSTLYSVDIKIGEKIIKSSKKSHTGTLYSKPTGKKDIKIVQSTCSDLSLVKCKRDDDKKRSAKFQDGISAKKQPRAIEKNLKLIIQKKKYNPKFQDDATYEFLDDVILKQPQKMKLLLNKPQNSVKQELKQRTLKLPKPEPEQMQLVDLEMKLSVPRQQETKKLKQKRSESKSDIVASSKWLIDRTCFGRKTNDIYNTVMESKKLGRQNYLTVNVPCKAQKCHCSSFSNTWYQINQIRKDGDVFYKNDTLIKKIKSASFNIEETAAYLNGFKEDCEAVKEYKTIIAECKSNLDILNSAVNHLTRKIENMINTIRHLEVSTSPRESYNSHGNNVNCNFSFFENNCKKSNINNKSTEGIRFIHGGKYNCTTPVDELKHKIYETSDALKVLNTSVNELMNHYPDDDERKIIKICLDSISSLNRTIHHLHEKIATSD